MPALNLDTDAEQIAERMADAETLLVACLCAEWCGTCRDYREGFDRLADAHPDICFAWIDIEDHADRFDDLGLSPLDLVLIVLRLERLDDGEKIISMYPSLSRPTPCSPVMVPPASTQTRMISRMARSTRADSSAS